MRTRWLNLGLLGTLLLGAGSCASCAKYQNVGIQSTPEGAEIFLDGEKVGETPRQLAVARDGEHAVYLKKPGYRPELVVLELHQPSAGPTFLTPADVRVSLTPILGGHDRSLEIEAEAPRDR